MKNFFCFFAGIFLLVFLVASVAAVPTQIATCQAPQCMLTAPRYKMVQSFNDPNDLWIMYDRGGALPHYIKSADGGASWNAAASMEVQPYLSDHTSIAIDELDNVYMADRTDSTTGSTFTSVYFRKINAPGESASDLEPYVLIPAAVSGPQQTPNILVWNATHSFVIMRTSANAAGNIYYARSTNGGATFSAPQLLYASGAADVRIGSFLIGDANPVPAVILHYVSVVGSPNIDYQYFVWNEATNSFDVPADNIVVNGRSTTNDRYYAMAYANGENHLVFNDGSELVHAWKEYNGGVGTWNEEVVETLSGEFYYASLSRYGNNLYLFYTIPSGAGRDIVYRMWNKSTQSWSARTTITVGATSGQDNRWPQAPAIINPSSTFIPVAWNRGDTETVWYEMLSASGQQSDTTPPVLSNGQPSGSLASGTTQVNMNVTTNEAATCRYATSAGVSYASMTNTFTTTGATLHNELLTGLADGSSYSYYVRCNDSVGNVNTNDFTVSFSVLNGGSSSGGGVLDVNADGNVNIIDLALATFWQGKTNAGGDWNNYAHLDVNADGSVNWLDIVEIVLGI